MSQRARQQTSSRVAIVTAIGVAVATLYFAQQVLIPVALAILLAFLLAPMVTRVERMKLPRVPAVLLVTIIAFSIIILVGWVVGRQVVSLSQSLPQYQEEIVHKIGRLRGQGGRLGANMEHFVDALSMAARGENPLATTQPTGTQTAVVPGATPSNPLYMQPIATSVSPISTLVSYFGLVFGQLGTAGLVIVFCVFMLLEREDLRDRLIYVISHGKYTVTTRAINDGATRISRYMLAQSIVNGSYGLTVSLGLWFIGKMFGHGIGFPSFILWGLICAVFRFVPYIGPWIAAAFPVLLSLAVYSGFTVFAATVGMFVVIELASNNIMEPWLYGASTGLSTVAIMVAAVFWTWLWGAIGLLLSTPLTVCIVVLGKYVAHLKFLDVLLSDQPALPRSIGFYQRLLAGNREEAAALVRLAAKMDGEEHLPDEVFIPALVMARHDRADEDLSAADESALYEKTIAILEKRRTENSLPAKPATGITVLGCPAHHRSEELVLEMLGDLLKIDGIGFEAASTRVLLGEIESRVERDKPAAVFIAVVPPGGAVQARYLCRRLRKRFADLWIVVGYWGQARNFDRMLVRFRSAGASYVTTSLLQSRSQLLALIGPAEHLAPSREAENPLNRGPALAAPVDE